MLRHDPLRDPFSVYYDAIFKPAIIKAHLTPVRADDLFRPSVIVSDLWQMIQEAKLLLAELTTKNANVFYELGLAHAIGKPVVLVSETMHDVPFDLQQMRVLLYDKNDPSWGEKLSEGITKALAETLNRPIEAVPSIFRKTVASQAPEQDITTTRLDALESQMRMLRARAPRRSIAYGQWEEELRKVGSSGELDGWAKKWRDGGVPWPILKNSIMSSEIPVYEIERLERKLGET